MLGQEHIKKQIINHLRRLQKLKEQKALYGISTDPRILTEIEDIEIEIDRLRMELDKIETELGGSFITSEQKRVYHNLPQPDYERFIGRKTELKKIRGLLLQESRHFVITIDGIGGIGKSALALEVAQSYLRYHRRMPKNERFQAIVWATAKLRMLTSERIVYRSQSLDLVDIYSIIAITLEREDISRAQPKEQGILVRQALTQRRVLLIIDNLETVDDERVVSFINEVPAPTKVIVTTRHRLDVAYPIRLVGMPEPDALALISDEAKQKNVTLTKNEAHRLYRRTGGVPLAIVWGIAQMGLGYEVESVLTRLGRPNENIAKFCLEGVIEHIKGKPAHKLLMALSLFATSASRKVLGYAANVSELDRDDALVDLEKLSLVNKQQGPYETQFSLLPLVKSYAREELLQQPHSFVRSMLQNLEKWLALEEVFSGVYWGWDDSTINRELGNNLLELCDVLSVFIDFTSFQYDHNDKFLEDLNDALLQFIPHTVLYLKSVGRRTEALKLAVRGCELANLKDKKYILAWLETGIGWILAQQNNIEESLIHLELSKEYYELLGDMSGFYLSTCYIGQALRRAKRFSEAEKVIRHTLEQTTLSEVRVVGEFELGKLYRDKKQWLQAYDHHIAAYEAIKATSNVRTQMMELAIRSNCGGLALKLGKLDEAKKLCYEVLLELEVQMNAEGDQYPRTAANLSSQVYFWLATAEVQLKEFDKASFYARRALRLSRMLNDQVRVNEVIELLGISKDNIGHTSSS